VTIGVIMPVRAPAPWFGEALDAVLAEEPAEVVVVDDGSPEPIAVPDGVRLVRLAAPGGPAAARQRGLAELSADLVALADADDVWERGKLAAQVAALERWPEAALVFGRAVVVGPDGGPTGERWPEPPPGVHTGAALRLYERNPIPTASVVVRHSALEEVGGFDSGLGLAAGTDWELWLRLAAADHRFGCEPAARIRYRRHRGGVTSDISRLAEAGLAIHLAHAGLVDADTAARVRAADLVALARGRIRERRWSEAVAALDEAAALAPLGGRERALRALIRVPGARAALGRRDPYRRLRSGA